jgi:mannose-1-phosphate guanylyltransferase
MAAETKTWALVLAAGEGSRLRRLTTTRSGASVPKQFCSLRGGLSLFHEALHRAHTVTSRSRTCAVLAKHHRIWWQGLPRALPMSNVIVQPANRGTANGILLPLLHVIERDSQARILVLPSDHHVRDERALSRSLSNAIEQVEARPEYSILVGIEPKEPDPELGYIVPYPSDGPGALPVKQFVEKPSAGRARRIIEQGGLWNAFIIATRAQTLMDLFRRRIPDITKQMHAAVKQDLARDESSATEALYQRLPTIDFSRDILEGQESCLRVLPVPDCGWSDLGTPVRVETLLRQLSQAPASEIDRLDWSYLSLATQYEHQRTSRRQPPQP